MHVWRASISISSEFSLVLRGEPHQPCVCNRLQTGAKMCCMHEGSMRCRNLCEKLGASANGRAQKG